ncbi:MAG: hypothetical protein RDU59_10170 [Thermodesulfobacteriota bacterium]|nr:hypothetical protein [Thermodesulfobacteriota bacterium]
MRSISIFFSVAMVFLSGCASMFYASTQMPVQGKEELAKIKNPALVKIEREDNMWGGAIPFVIYDGKKEIGRLGPSGAFDWKREAGYLKLTITGAVRTIVGPNLPDEAIYEDYIDNGATLSFLSGLNVDRKIAIWIKPQQKQAPEDIIAFGRAEDLNTINAYETFMKTYAKSSKVDEAIRRCDNVIEKAGILNIDNLKNKNIDIIQAYLKALPKGKYAQFAEEVNQYYEAEKRPSKKAFEDYLQKWPNGHFEKWAKDNLAFTSFGVVDDHFLVKVMELAGQHVRREFKPSVKRSEKYELSEAVSFKRTVRLDAIGGRVFRIEGSLNEYLKDASKYSIYYIGEASGDGFKYEFTLQFNVVTEPHFNIDRSASGFLVGSKVKTNDKQYYYDGRHWVHGLFNQFFKE